MNQQEFVGGMFRAASVASVVKPPPNEQDHAASQTGRRQRSQLRSLAEIHDLQCGKLRDPETLLTTP